MKKLIFIFSVLFCVLNLFPEETPRLKSNVGDVVYSVLTLQQFKATHGTEWALLDGSPLDQTTELAFYTGLTNLPDARGVFIRGMNVLRDIQTGDVSGENRQVGSYQTDEIRRHSHVYSFTSTLPGVYDRNATSLTSENNDGIKFEQETNASGGNETRPKNIALYTYINIGKKDFKP